VHPQLAHRVESLRCEGSDAIGAKPTWRERSEAVDLTKMTHLRYARVRISAVQIDHLPPVSQVTNFCFDGLT